MTPCLHDAPIHIRNKVAPSTVGKIMNSIMGGLGLFVEIIIPELIASVFTSEVVKTLLNTAPLEPGSQAEGR